MDHFVAQFHRVYVINNRDRLADFTFSFMKGKSYELYTDQIKGEMIRELLFGRFPDSGSATVCSKVSVMLSDLSAYEHMTLKQIVGYFADIFSVGAETSGRIIHKLSETGISKRIQTRHFPEFQKKQIALEISLMDYPDILLLDAKQTFGVEVQLEEFVKTGGCLIILNHGCEVEFLADVVSSV